MIRCLQSIWDFTTPELKEASQQRRKELFYPKPTSLSCSLHSTIEVCRSVDRTRQYACTTQTGSLDANDRVLGGTPGCVAFVRRPLLKSPCKVYPRKPSALYRARRNDVGHAGGACGEQSCN
jgi:hypothetical protein